MCGILGGISFTGRYPVSREFLEAGADLMAHRGPDDAGAATGKNWGLAFRRLAILDLSQAGHQPMAGPEGDCYLVFNGEIYNYRELRRELEGKGIRFDSTGDAQVLLQVLRTWGSSGIPRLNGMFAFAFLDLRRGKLLLARDRLGQKPLLYYADGDRFLFSSEIKALLQAPSLPREVDPVAVSQYFCFNYVPAPRTTFKGISKLMPGHFLEIPLREPSTPEPEAYWRLRFESTQGRSRGEWIDELVPMLEDSVALRLRSDVRTGTFLSGGIDSGLVTSLAARAPGAQQLTAFTMGFPEPDWDESEVARAVATHVGLRHEVSTARPDAWRLLPDLVRHYEEPYADSSAVPTYLLCEAASEFGTVFLSGDGGDEAFAGYRRYQKALGTRWLDLVPRSVRRLAGGIFGRVLRDDAPLRRKALKVGLPDWLRAYSHTVFVQDPLNLEPVTPEVRATWEEVMEPLLSLRGEAEALPLLSMLQYLDFQLYLSNDILVKVDRASMAHSIEVRCPFLDHRVIDLASKIPPHLHTRDGRGKALLREVARSHLPPEALASRKRGFGVPFPRWFQERTLDHIGEYLTEERVSARGIYDMEGIRKLLQRQRDGRGDFSHALWRLMFFEEWMRQFHDGSVDAVAGRRMSVG